MSACSVRFVATDEGPVTTNQCSTNQNCGPGASCLAGACFATRGAIDNVLLEFVPQVSSSGGGLSFLSSHGGVGSGNRHLDVALHPASFNAAINANGASFPSDCTQVPSDQISVEGLIEFTPASSSGEFPTYGLVAAPVTVNVAAQTNGGLFGRTLLAPGTYDIYVQAKSPLKCALPPLFLRASWTCSIRRNRAGTNSHTVVFFPSPNGVSFVFPHTLQWRSSSGTL